MTADEIRQEIIRLERKLDDLNNRKKSAERDQENVEETIAKINAAVEKMENEIKRSLNQIRQSVEQVVGRTKCKQNYL